MHKLFMAFVLSAATSVLWAQSPFVGTWKLNPAKTKYTAGEAPSNQLVVVEAEGEMSKVTATVTMADGTALTSEFTVPSKGAGAGQVKENALYDAVNAKMVKDVSELTYLKGGKQVMWRRSVVSPDGKTMKSTVKGSGPAGPLAGVEIYDKQ